MRHHVLQGNPVFLHEHRGEFGSPLGGGRAVVATVFAHFNTDREAVSRTREICVFTLFTRGHVLDGHAVLHGEMPNQIANPVSRAGFRRSQCSVF